MSIKSGFDSFQQIALANKKAADKKETQKKHEIFAEMDDAAIESEVKASMKEFRTEKNQRDGNVEKTIAKENAEEYAKEERAPEPVKTKSHLFAEMDHYFLTGHEAQHHHDHGDIKVEIFQDEETSGFRMR